MALPDATLNTRDGALGIVPPNSNNIALKCGPCVLGVVNSLNAVNDLPSLRAACGNTGPTVEAAAVSLSQAGGPLYVVPVNPGTYGTCGSVTKVGSGAETLTVLAKPAYAFVLKCSVAGSVSTAQFQLSLDGGLTYGAAFLTAATVQLPGYSFVTMAFGSGTAVVGDTYSVATDGTVTAGGSNTGTLAVTINSVSPSDNYKLVVTLTVAGALGTAQFTYSLDGGLTTTGNQLVPSSGKFVIPDAGVLLTFGGTSTATDYFTCTITAPTYTTTDLTNAFNAIIALPQTWFLFHVVGEASSAAAAATLAATLDTLLTTAGTAFRFARGLVECPWDKVTNTDSVVSAAFATTSSLRVGCGVAHATIVSPIKGHQLSRSVAWEVAARLAKNAPAVDAAEVDIGALTGIVSLDRDEQATPLLDAARFCTLRTIIGRQGYYITNARTLAPTGSDYTYFVNGRVMDIFCAAFRNGALQYLNGSVTVNATTGNINEPDAKAIENYIDGQCRAVLTQTQPPAASSLSISVTRNNNILSTQQLQITGRVVPLGYARAIVGDLGFTNPALAQK